MWSRTSKGLGAARGLEAAYLRDNGVNGQDLLELTSDSLTTDLRCTPFAARKVLSARDEYLFG